MSIKALWPWLALFALLSGAAVVLFAPFTSHHTYEYDSADYMYAGVQGFWANYTDRASVPFWEFVRKGIELKNDPAKRAETSLHARRIGDMNAYRHFHGPLYAYWIAAWSALGVEDEYTTRNLGFVAHIATSLLVAFAFWTLFPTIPRFVGFLTGAAFLFNRTALVTAVVVTQHIAFVFTAVLTLWMLGLFVRRFQARYWYATMASLALAVAAVETSALIGATIVVVLAILYRPLRERWPSLRDQFLLLVKGIGVFAAVLFVFWPAGLYKLSVLRGFLFLAYMALERKTFALHGPLEVWRMKFASYGWEQGFLFGGFVLAIVLWRRLDHKREALPWLVYGAVFALATMKVTLEYTHYRGSVAAVWVMAAGIAIGHLVKHSGTVVRTAVLAVSVLCIVMATADYRAEVAARPTDPSATDHVVQFVKNHPVPAGKTLYVPYYFVPALHLYYPDLETVGYDVDWPTERLLTAVQEASSYGEILCVEQTCLSLEAAAGRSLPRTPVAPVHDGQRLYAMRTSNEALTGAMR